MERRSKVRKPTAVRVYLSSPGQRIRRCNAKDLSVSGAFVEGEALGLARGLTVELVFVMERGSVIRIHRVPATVARVSKWGAGLMLPGYTRTRRSAIRPQAYS